MPILTRPRRLTALVPATLVLALAGLAAPSATAADAAVDVGQSYVTATAGVVPADGQAAHTVTIHLRDAAGQPVVGQAARLYVSAWCAEAAQKVELSAQADPAHPGDYTVRFSTRAAGRWGIAAYVDSVEQVGSRVVEFAPVATSGVEFLADQLQAGFGQIGREEGAFIVLPDPHGEPLADLPVEFTSPDPDLWFVDGATPEVYSRSVMVTTTAHGMAAARMAYDGSRYIGTAQTTCFTVDIQATPRGLSTQKGQLTVCPPTRVLLAAGVEPVPADGLTAAALTLFIAAPADAEGNGYLITDRFDEVTIEAPGATVGRFRAADGESVTVPIRATTPGTVWVTAHWGDLVSDPVAIEFVAPPDPMEVLRELLAMLREFIKQLIAILRGLNVAV